MRLITQRELIRTVAGRYRAAHAPFMDKLSHGMVWDLAKGMHIKKPTTEEISKALDKLDPETATAEDVDVIMGISAASSWVRLKCGFCGNDFQEMVVDDGRDLQICRECLGAAMELLNQPDPVIHDSDCAVYRAPAYPAGECNCQQGTVPD